MSPPGAFPVPDQLPGEIVRDPDHLYALKQQLANICGLTNTRFPGSQPVSFDRDSLAMLETEDFWVCEKSDGVRVLVLILSSAEFGQEVYLVDRKEEFYRVHGITFPHQDGPAFLHSNTVLDGEFVIDVDRETGRHIPRLLTFDCIVLDGENLMQKPLMKRYGRLKEFVMKPHQRQLEAEPGRRAEAMFEVIVKSQELAYGIHQVLTDRIPRLLHGNDGLIFTSAEAPYTPGTDRKILKWKPPSENSIDFRLQLKFPARADDPALPDFSAKPAFLLLMNHGREGSHYYDVMEVGDGEWEEWKRSGEQYDDRVVEVTWDKEGERWVFMRFRDDKREGNFKTVVENIIRSIQHGVEAETLVEHSGRIRAAWKERQARRSGPQRPPQQGQQLQLQGQGQGQGAPPPMQGAGGYGGGQRPQSAGAYGGLKR